MRGTSPPGLTARDFHPPSFINPRDVFPIRSRQRLRPAPKADKNTDNFQISPSSSSSTSSVSQLSYCAQEPLPKSAPCVDLGVDEVTSAPSPGSCEGNCDKCEDCFEDHQECDEDKIQCVDDCDECSDEHEKACGQHGQVCTETCDDCDFSCFDCVDWQAFEQDKDLGLSFSVPLLNDSTMTGLEIAHDGIDSALTASAPQTPLSTEFPAPPVNFYMHHQCLQNSTPFWNELMPSQCPVESRPAWNMVTPTLFQSSAPMINAYGCHPAAIHQASIGQQSLPSYDATSAIQDSHDWAATQARSQQMASSNTDAILNGGIMCQWLMPCGSTCGASFATLSDLRKHLKAIHCIKGTTKCAWADCGASFATEAALTGHISKKHLSSSLTDTAGPFKCTFPGCNKSFMYKQVRDEHLTSHNGGNKMYCHICGQFLNSEGSNFRRHMASHQPKHEHMMCKYHHLGCKKRFPRLDNLRRHESVCRVGRKAALHHHHYHRHVGHS